MVPNHQFPVGGQREGGVVPLGGTHWVRAPDCNGEGALLVAVLLVLRGDARLRAARTVPARRCAARGGHGDAGRGSFAGADLGCRATRISGADTRARELPAVLPRNVRLHARDLAYVLPPPHRARPRRRGRPG